MTKPRNKIGGAWGPADASSRAFTSQGLTCSSRRQGAGAGGSVRSRGSSRRGTALEQHQRSQGPDRRGTKQEEPGVRQPPPLWPVSGWRLSVAASQTCGRRQWRAGGWRQLRAGGWRRRARDRAWVAGAASLWLKVRTCMCE
jgi:hypothetical protein